MKDEEEGGLWKVGPCEKCTENEDGEDSEGNETAAEERVEVWIREEVLRTKGS